MKRTFLALLAVAALAAISAGQNAPAGSNPVPQGATPATGSAAQAESQNQIPAGVVIAAELSKSVDAKKVKSGDKIEARTSMDLLSQGKIVIPRNTKIVGHVTQAKAHSKDSPDSTLGIVFDRVAMKDGREMQMQAAIQAIARPLQSAALSESAPMPDSGGMPASAPTMSGGGMGGSSPRSSSPAGSYPGGVSTSPSDPGAPSGTPAPLGPTSQGVVGMKGLELKSAGAASVISSEKDNVKLESGTQMILRTQ